MRMSAGRDLFWKVPRTSGMLECTRRRCADRDVVGVAIGTIGAKGDHDVRPKCAYNPDDRAGQFVWVDILKCPIHVVQHPRMVNAELLARSIEFALTHLAERVA